MASKPETRLQQKIVDSLTKRGAWVMKVHGSPYQKRGVPDLLVCYLGRFIALEIKTPEDKDKVTPLQLKRIDDIKKAGGISLVITSVEQANRVLDFVDKKLKNIVKNRVDNDKQ